MFESDSFAVVVSAPALDQPTREQAQLSDKLVNLKVSHGLEVVSEARARYAKRILISDMRVFFHQGGAPSIWAREFPGAGRLVAAGYYVGLDLLYSAVPAALLHGTRSIFPDRKLTHLVQYRDIKHIPKRLQPLTKEIIGRPPRPGENYIVVEPTDQGYQELTRLWTAIMSPSENTNCQPGD